MNNVWIEEKHTKHEHTNRVGFLIGLIVENANLMSYDTLVKYFRQIKDRDVEIKKNTVFEGNERKWCLTVYSIRSAMDAVDYGLRKMSAKNKTHIKYISFKNSTKADRIARLKLNQLLNVQLKYE